MPNHGVMTYPIATATRSSQAHSVQLNYPRPANSVCPFLERPHHTYHPPTLLTIFSCPCCNSKYLWPRTTCNLWQVAYRHLRFWHCRKCRSTISRHWCNIRFCCRRRTKHRWCPLCISFHPRVWHRRRRRLIWGLSMYLLRVTQRSNRSRPSRSHPSSNPL